jgi:hypothetical protein
MGFCGLKPHRFKYFPMLRSEMLKPVSRTISCAIATVLHRKKSILSCSGRLSMMIFCIWLSRLSMRLHPTPSDRLRGAGLSAGQQPALNRSMALRAVGYVKTDMSTICAILMLSNAAVRFSFASRATTPVFDLARFLFPPILDHVESRKFKLL